MTGERLIAAVYGERIITQLRRTVDWLDRWRFERAVTHELLACTLGRSHRPDLMMPDDR